MMHKGVMPGSRLSRNWAIVDHPPETAEDGPVALLRSVIAVALRHRVKLLIWVVTCVAVAGLYARSMPPTYTAAATLLLEPRRQAATSGREPVATPSLDLNRADSELQVIRSERLLTTVFESLDLVNHAELKPPPPGLLRSLLTDARHALSDAASSVGRVFSPANGSRQDVTPAEAAAALADAEEARQNAFQNFARRLAARRVGQSYVIEISYSSSDPALPARVANAAISAYILQSVAFKADAARSGAEFLQGRVDALAAQVKAAASAMREGALPSSPTPDADARIIGAARQPLGPSAPKSELIIALGAVLGLMSGFLFAALGSVLDRKLRTAKQLARETGLPCLASVPEASNWNGLSRRTEIEMDSLAVFSPGGAFAASIRSLRTSIKLACSTPQDNENLVVALVAWAPNAGSSMLAMNLAHLINRGGRHVTVISADASVSHIVGNGSDVPAHSSLVDVLANNTRLEQIVFLDLDGVAMLPAQSVHSSLNHFVDYRDRKVARILEFARNRGDVLLDLPPLCDSADAIALAMYADAVVVVVAAGQTTVDELGEATRSLQRVGANVIGAVINRVKV